MSTARRFGSAAMLAAPLALFALSGCEVDEGADPGEADTTNQVATYWTPGPEFTEAELERSRYDDSWRRSASVDSFNRAWEESTGMSLAPPADDTLTAGALETWDDFRRLARPAPSGVETPPDTARQTLDTRRPPIRLAGLGARTGHGQDTLARADTAGSVSGSAAADTFEVRLPVRGRTEGPSVMIVQTLLDRVAFSPGIIDGRWGKNTETAVYWFQRQQSLPPTGRVDSVTYRRLRDRAGDLPPFRDVALTEDDVAGPFVEIPEAFERQAELDCMCYASVSERIAERMHASPEILQALNPDAVLDSLAAGDTLRIPGLAVRDSPESGPPGAAGRDTTVTRDTITPPDTSATRDTVAAPDTVADPDTVHGDSLPAETIHRSGVGETVARIVISDRGHYLHALDDEGRIVWHFPTTLGSEYNPSPAGEMEITSITFDPWFHYQPDLLQGRETGERDYRIPPGPNNPVGIVWMQLSKEHFGIHGTARPATIGHTTSHGCVRLTNWDARFMGERIEPGISVRFIDVSASGSEGESQRTDEADTTRASGGSGNDTTRPSGTR